MDYSENRLHEVPLGPIVELEGAEEGAKFSISLDQIPRNAHSNLCSLCTGLTLSRLITEESVPHQPSFQALSDSVALGCSICMLFRAAVLQEYRTTPNGSGWDEDRTTNYQLWRDRQDRYGKRGFFLQYLQNPYRRASAHLGVAYKRHEQAWEPERYTYLEEDTRNEDVEGKILNAILLLSTCDPFNSQVNGRPITKSLNLDLCRGWIKTCAENHTSCGKIAETALPERVIDIGKAGTQHPRLVETLGRRGTYITLSIWKDCTFRTNKKFCWEGGCYSWLSAAKIGTWLWNNQ